MCWNITGSPPPAALKKEVPKKRSVSSIVTAPASTGIAAISRNAVISQVHTNSGMRSRVIPGARMLSIVTMMLIAPMIDDMPSRCTAKMRKGTFMPPWSTRGGYIVQPAAGAPPGMKKVEMSRIPAKGSIQKLQLFIRGSAMSGAPIMIGTCQFANPTNAGMIAPNTMMRPCIAVNWLKRSGFRSCSPGWKSSARIPIARKPPTKSIVRAKRR